MLEGMVRSDYQSAFILSKNILMSASSQLNNLQKVSRKHLSAFVTTPGTLPDTQMHMTTSMPCITQLQSMNCHFYNCKAIAITRVA